MATLITKRRYYVYDTGDNAHNAYSTTYTDKPKYTVPANSQVAAYTNVALSGYTPLGIIQNSFAEHGMQVSMTFSQVGTSGSVVMVWRNFDTSPRASHLQIDVLYIKS